MGHREPESNQDDVRPTRDTGRSPYAGLDVDAIMEKVRAELRSRGVLPVVGGESRSETGCGFPLWQPAAARLADKSQYTLGDFLGFDDEDFIDVVYRKLLHHSATSGEAQGYLDALRHSHLSKVEVLGLIRFSPEGRKQGVHVDGLLLRYKLQRLQRVKVLGWFVRMGVAVARLPRLAWRLQGMEARAAREAQRVGRLVNDVENVISQRFSEMESAISTLRKETDALRDQAVAHEAVLGTHEMMHGAHDVKLDAHEVKLDTQDAMLSTHDAKFDALQGRARDDQRKLRAMLERLTVFLDAAARGQSRSDDSNGSNVPIDASAPALERQYASFEKTFRGDPELIKLRVAHYLDTLSNAGIDPDDDNVILDLGSGRGEWLEVLAEHSYHARGVDSNRSMLDESEARGHEVVQADALDYLRAQEDDSFAAISSLHMVEHIPHAILIELLDQALRVLRPGGVLILETPNPENVRVGSYTFYMDPTHRNPIPPLLLQWVVQARGFEHTVIERLSEHRGEPVLLPVPDEVPAAAQINLMVEWFTTAPDYAVIARKPSAA